MLRLKKRGQLRLRRANLTLAKKIKIISAEKLSYATNYKTNQNWMGQVHNK